MTKRQDLCLQRRSRPEQSDQRQPNQAANISHQPGASPDSTALTFPADLAVTRVSLCCADCRSRSDRIGIVVLVALPPYDDALDLGDVGGVAILKLTSLLGQPKQNRNVSWVALQGADDDATHNRFSLGYLFDVRSVPERDLLVQDPIEERLEVLISFGPPAGIT